MTLEVKLIPDGSAQVPVEGADHGLLADRLKGADPPEHSPAPSWQDIQRVVPGHRRWVALRIEGTLDDYASGALDGFATAAANVSGLKTHPDGWQEIETEETTA